MSISVLTKGMSCLFFCFCVCCMNAQVRNTDPVRHLRISGYLGQRIDACIEYRVKAQDVAIGILGKMDTRGDRLIPL